MPKREFAEIVQDITKADGRYSQECYSFVREGLDHTLKSLKRAGTGPKSHVSGQELLHGLRDYALGEFGPMSKSVLNEWGIEKCEDFGEIVFNLVKFNVLGKTDADSLSDFKNGFSFHEAFVKPYRPEVPRVAIPAPKAAASRPRKNKPATSKAKAKSPKAPSASSKKLKQPKSDSSSNPAS
jgi:uncharacterized repeat protein (TIGR04138 family)